jgi:hypothetical protein
MAEKKSRICSEKKNSTECPFWVVSALSDHCACPFLAFSAHWTTVDHKHGPLSTRKLVKKISRPNFGAYNPIIGSKRSIFTKIEKKINNKFFCTNIKINSL